MLKNYLKSSRISFKWASEQMYRWGMTRHGMQFFPPSLEELSRPSDIYRYIVDYVIVPLYTVTHISKFAHRIKVKTPRCLANIERDTLS